MYGLNFLQEKRVALLTEISWKVFHLGRLLTKAFNNGCSYNTKPLYNPLIAF